MAFIQIRIASSKDISTKATSVFKDPDPVPIFTTNMLLFLQIRPLQTPLLSAKGITLIT
jgi:hypothetical protein